MATRHGSATVTLPSDTEILITRSFDAPAALVWDALTQPRHLLRWWGPDYCPLVSCDVDFRVGGHIFATLASVKEGYGNLMLTPEQQTQFVDEMPDVFLPIAGGWGRMGATHIRLARASEDVLTGALRTAWKLRVEKNGKAGKPRKKRP